MRIAALFEEGRQAFLGGRSRGTNPHRDMNAGHWDHGWDHAAEEAAADGRRNGGAPEPGEPPLRWTVDALGSRTGLEWWTGEYWAEVPGHCRTPEPERRRLEGDLSTTAEGGR
jgi:ribosome modulation factor